MSDSITTTGKIIRIDDTVTRGTFRSRKFRIFTGEKYPQTLEMEMLKERCDVLDHFAPGDVAHVKWAPQGNVPTSGPYDGRCFISLVAWSVVKVLADGSPASRDGASIPPERAAKNTAGDDSEDEIPF